MSLYDVLFRFLVNLISVVILVRFIYYPRHKNQDFLFTYILFNILNFLICLLLSTTKLKIGFAFGLFAIFSILRYRTVTVPIKEMGYFFACVAIGIINALAQVDEKNLILLVCNGLVLALILILDRFSLTHENVKQIVYERIDLILPDRRDEMIADLQMRTGLPIHKIEIRSIDFLRDIAVVHVYFFSKHSEGQLAAELMNKN